MFNFWCIQKSVKNPHLKEKGVPSISFCVTKFPTSIGNQEWWKTHSLLLRGVSRGNTSLKNHIDRSEVSYTDNPYLIKKTTRITSQMDCQIVSFSKERKIKKNYVYDKDFDRGTFTG